MAVKDVLKITRKTFFNPLGWLGYNEIKNYNRIIFSIIGGLTQVEKPERTETFEEAMQRLDVTEGNIKTISEKFLSYTIVFVVLAAITFAASFLFLFEYHTFSGWILALACTAILAAYAFRFHFWYFQIKHRKLGCTVAEWWHGAPTIDKDAS